jgi:cation transport protein ChaC
VADESLWIFGYGSLVWRPAFPHRRSCAASIRGHVRRFWQGSTDHRGLPERPGRVVTLVPESGQGRTVLAGATPPECWGTAYEIPAHDPGGVLGGLDHRERGGYDRVEIEIALMRPEIAAGSRTVPGLVYIAGPENANYLGAASVEEIARQISTAVGPSGANPDYVFELARSLRAMGAIDDHVFAVESALQGLGLE